jgi:hypothetical protein
MTVYSSTALCEEREFRAAVTTCARRAIAVLCAAVMQFRQQQHQLIVVASGDRVVLPGA